MTPAGKHIFHKLAPENHQANPIERLHRTLWAMCQSQRLEGQTSWRSAVKTAVSLYNQSPQALIVPQVFLQVFLGRDLHLPGDLLRMELPQRPPNSRDQVQ